MFYLDQRIPLAVIVCLLGKSTRQVKYMVEKNELNTYRSKLREHTITDDELDVEMENILEAFPNAGTFFY